MKRFAAPALRALLRAAAPPVSAAILLLATCGPARADSAPPECETCLSASGFGFEITMCDSVPACPPGADAACEARLRRHFERSARLLSRAVEIRRILAADSVLDLKLRDAILHLDTGADDSLRQVSTTRYVRHKPALLKRFVEIPGTLPGPMRTVLLGAYASARQAEARARAFPELCAAWRIAGGDSTWPTWKVTDCGRMVAWHADLFVLPPGVGGPGRWRVMSGLFLEEATARRAVARLRRGHGGEIRVQPIGVDGKVLRTAREWAEKVEARR